MLILAFMVCCNLLVEISQCWDGADSDDRQDRRRAADLSWNQQVHAGVPDNHRCLRHGYLPRNQSRSFVLYVELLNDAAHCIEEMMTKHFE